MMRNIVLIAFLASPAVGFFFGGGGGGGCGCCQPAAAPACPPPAPAPACAPVSGCGGGVGYAQPIQQASYVQQPQYIPQQAPSYIPAAPRPQYVAPAPVAPQQQFVPQQGPSYQVAVAPSGGSYAAPSGGSYAAVAAAGDKLQEVEEEGTSADAAPAESEVAEVAESIDIKKLKLTNDPECNSEELRTIIVDNIDEDLNSSKRLIQLAAEAKFGGRFDVICSTNDFSYVTNTEVFCQHTKNSVSCYAYRQI